MNNKRFNLALRAMVLCALSALLLPTVHAQTPLAWDATRYFRYVIEKIVLDSTSAPRTVKVIFSVVNSDAGTIWDIKSDSPFTTSGATLVIDIGWNTAEFINKGSQFGTNPALGGGIGAAFPIRLSALSSAAKACTSNAECPVAETYRRFYISSPLPVEATDTGRVAIEGHPRWEISVSGIPVVANVPVKSEYQDFVITGAFEERKQIVDIAKCKRCHDDRQHGDTIVPRLALHGANRNEELGVCVICHNSSQTDIPYRTSLPEESVDFKRMIHEIHAGGFRENALIIIGRGGSVNDFSYVRFPAELRNCTNCHIDVNGKGTFELPLRSTAMGSTINTGTILPGGPVDVDPENDLRITPIAAVCSACHDKREVKDHMIRRGGASFSAFQWQIDNGSIRERCPSCHGPGRQEDVRRAHEIGRSGESSHDD